MEMNNKKKERTREKENGIKQKEIAENIKQKRRKSEYKIKIKLMNNPGNFLISCFSKLFTHQGNKNAEKYEYQEEIK